VDYAWFEQSPQSPLRSGLPGANLANKHAKSPARIPAAATCRMKADPVADALRTIGEAAQRPRELASRALIAISSLTAATMSLRALHVPRARQTSRSLRRS
jgi:hypothetical protein